jgi:MFS family permease
LNNRAEIDQHAADSQSIRPWSSLLIRDFRLLWTASVLTSLAVQIRNVSNLYQVYQLSGSAFMLGLTGFLETLPFIIFGLFAGAVADAFDRKKVLLLTMVLQLIPGVAMAFLTYTGTVQVWHIYSLGFVGAFVDVFNWPARAALVPRLVPPGLMMNAVTINSMIIQLSFLVGPALAGLSIDHTGLVTTYSISTLLLVPAIASILWLRASGKVEGRKRQVNLRSIVEGIEFIWIQRIILSLFLLDFGVTLVGFYRPILPIFAADVFNMGASGLGLLYAAPSAGSLIGSMTLLMAGDIKQKGIAVVLAAIGFAASLALLGVSHRFWLAVAAVIILGITDSISVAIRRTVVQLLAPNEMLGRANSLITVFAQTTNGLGALLAGVAAQFMGAPNSLLVGSALCFLMILATCVAIPQLWRYRSD